MVGILAFQKVVIIGNSISLMVEKCWIFSGKLVFKAAMQKVYEFLQKQLKWELPAKTILVPHGINGIPKSHLAKPVCGMEALGTTPYTGKEGLKDFFEV